MPNFPHAVRQGRNAAFINWFQLSDPDRHYLPTGLPFSLQIKLWIQNNEVVRVFDDYILRNNGTISLFVELYDTDHSCHTVTFSPEFNRYHHVLSSLQNPTTNPLDGIYDLHNDADLFEE